MSDRNDGQFRQVSAFYPLRTPAKKARMDPTETFAKEFLEQLGHANPTYEPDGNVPPDFLTNDGTAVEVRRLNQIYVDKDGGVHTLETADAALWQTMGSLLDAYRSPLATNSTFGVFYQFRRPIPLRRVIDRELKAELDQFLSGSRDLTVRRKLPCGLGLRIMDFGVWRGTPFRLAGALDEQRGGWVIQQLAGAIRLALREKDRKVESYKGIYQRWWLVLVDPISWGTDENDRRQLRATGPFDHSFERVFVVNALRSDDYFEL